MRRDKQICQTELHAAHESAVPISAMMAHQGRSRCGVLDFLLGQLVYVRWNCHIDHLGYHTMRPI